MHGSADCAERVAGHQRDQSRVQPVTRELRVGWSPVREQAGGYHVIARRGERQRLHMVRRHFGHTSDGRRQHDGHCRFVQSVTGLAISAAGEAVKAILAMLGDRKRSQRGSVLSGVLIITLFLGVISGALMTALSSDFLLSHNLANRMTTEATVRSAAELAVDQLQTTPLGAQCPNPLPSASLNQQVAATSYLSCLQRRVIAVPSSASFGVDGARVVRAGADEYL